jgi:hypothetical protein
MSVAHTTLELFPHNIYIQELGPNVTIAAIKPSNTFLTFSYVECALQLV